MSTIGLWAWPMIIHGLNLPRSHPAKRDFEPFAAGPFSLRLAAFCETRWMPCVSSATVLLAN